MSDGMDMAALGLLRDSLTVWEGVSELAVAMGIVPKIEAALTGDGWRATIYLDEHALAAWDDEYSIIAMAHCVTEFVTDCADPALEWPSKTIEEFAAAVAQSEET